MIEMSAKLLTRQKNADRITALATGDAKRLFNGNIAKGFLYWGADLLLQEVSDLPTEDDLLQNIVDGKDLGLDCYFVDEDEQTVWLFQSKYSSAPVNIPHKEISDFLRVPGRLVDPIIMSAKNTNAKVVDFAQTFRERVIAGLQIKLVFFTTNLNHEVVNTEVQNWNRLPLHLNVGGSEFEVEHSALIADLNDLILRFESIISDKPVETEIGIRPDYWHESPSGGFKCLIATIDLEELVQLFNTYKYAIFRENPRGPLGGVHVNKDICNTLNDDTLREHFHLLNNGISATCESFTPPSLVNGKYKTWVRDFQIVNGCQTTYTVWDYWRRGGGLTGACVNIKLVEGKNLRDLISKASNAQTQMKDWDFVSGDKIQKRLQAEFAKLNPPIFYQLRRGEYKYIADKEKGGYELITVKDIAQTAWALMGFPGEAKDRLREVAQSRSQSGGTYHKVFFKDATASFYTLPWRIYEKVKVEHEKYVEQTQLSGDFREYGRIHLVWLVGRGLIKVLGKNDVIDIKPQEVLRLVDCIDLWFGMLHNIGVETIKEVYRIEERAANKIGGKPVSLRQLFRSDSYYPYFLETHDEKLLDRKNELEAVRKQVM